jgi:hypothetical protein
MLMAALSFCGASGVALVTGVPDPKVTDELSYLLAADTYARGHLAAPSHPLWEHFENVHILQRPSYASKYLPGQGLILALGQVVGGHPIVGVWLGAAFMCAAVVWMLQAWLPSRWALFGGFITMLEFGIAGYWAQSYWGGALAAGGGALVLGAARRLHSTVALGSGLGLACGAAILSLTRPFEGLIVIVAAAVPVLRSADRSSFRRFFTAVVVPASFAMLCVATVLIRANIATTGNPTRTAYAEHSRQYNVAPIFLWQQPGTAPEYLQPEVREFHTVWELRQYSRQKSLVGWLRVKAERSLATMVVLASGPPQFFPPYLPGLLLLPLLFVPWAPVDRWTRHALATVGLVLLGLAGVTYFQLHYLAPITCLWVYFIVVGTRVATVRFGRNRPAGRLVAPILLAAVVLSLSLGVVSASRVEHSHTAWWTLKEDVDSGLAALGGRHVVLVRPCEGLDKGLVYNSARIDEQRVVWAWEMGGERDREVAGYYPDRKVWVYARGVDLQPRLEIWTGTRSGTPRTNHSSACFSAGTASGP